jgi:integrase
MRIDEYINHYYSFIETRKSDGTVSISKGVLKQFNEYLDSISISKLDQIKVTTINGYIDWLKCASKTKKNHVNVISLMIDQAIKEEILINNPTRLATIPEIKKRIKHRLLTPLDIEIIFRFGGVWVPYYLWLLHTGLRAGDLAVLTYGNINKARGVIINHVRKSRRVHEFPISNVLLETLSDGNKNKPLFPTLYDTKQNRDGETVIDEKRVHYLISKPRIHLQSMMIAHDRPKATLHSFRVTFNNTLRDLGLQIEDRKILLAHSTSETTKIYTHPNVQLARDYINKIPNPLASIHNVTIV